MQLDLAAFRKASIEKAVSISVLCKIVRNCHTFVTSQGRERVYRN